MKFKYKNHPKGDEIMKKNKSITELLQKRAELSAKLSLIPYEGSIEIKTRNNNKYIYLRKKTLNKNMR